MADASLQRTTTDNNPSAFDFTFPRSRRNVKGPARARTSCWTSLTDTVGAESMSNVSEGIRRVVLTPPGADQLVRRAGASEGKTGV